MVQLGHHEIDGFLTGLDIPNAVAREEHKLCLGVNWLDADVREGRDGLVSGLQLVVALIFEVAKGA